MAGEGTFQTKALEYLERRGAYAVNNHGTGITGSGRPDAFVCYRGWFVAFEWKDPNIDADKHTSAAQKLHIKRIRNAGGLAYACNTIDFIKQVLDRIDRETS